MKYRDISIRRFNLHTLNKKELKRWNFKSHEEVFDFCEKRNIIGTRLGNRW